MYRQPISLGWSKYLPFKKLIKKVVMHMPNFPGKNSILRGCTSLRERYISNTLGFENKEDIKKLMKNYNDKLNLNSLVASYYDKVNDVNDVSKMQYIDLKMWMTGDILLKADRMSMANSLELRVPFLDKEVFEVASRINPSWNLKEKKTKRILRKAARGIIPDLVLDRPKLGFPVPMSAWLKGDMKDWAMDVIENSNTDKYINKDYVKELYNRHISGDKDLKSELWTILTFMLWHKVYIEQWDDTVNKNLEENFNLEKKIAG